MNFASTNGRHRGNSGSRVINQNAELVGLIFDGNIRSLAGFTTAVTNVPAVNVHASIMMKALRKVYGASALADGNGHWRVWP